MHKFCSSFSLNCTRLFCRIEPLVFFIPVSANGSRPFALPAATSEREHYFWSANTSCSFKATSVINDGRATEHSMQSNGKRPCACSPHADGHCNLDGVFNCFVRCPAVILRINCFSRARARLAWFCAVVLCFCIQSHRSEYIDSFIGALWSDVIISAGAKKTPFMYKWMLAIYLMRLVWGIHCRLFSAQALANGHCLSSAWKWIQGILWSSVGDYCLHACVHGIETETEAGREGESRSVQRNTEVIPFSIHAEHTYRVELRPTSTG